MAAEKLTHQIFLDITRLAAVMAKKPLFARKARLYVASQRAGAAAGFKGSTLKNPIKHHHTAQTTGIN